MAYRVILTLLLIAGGSFSANADTISFSSLSQTGTGSTSEGNTYTQQGFTFADQLNGDGDGLSIWQASSPSLPSLNTADTSLFEFYAGSTTRLTDAGNAAFTLDSIDLAQYYNLETAGTFNVTFTGTFADSSTVSQTFTVDRFAGTPLLQTFAFSGFDNVVRVDFTQGVAVSGNAYQFDNLVVAPSSAVPEPSSLAMCCGGLAFLIMLSRRKRVS